MKQKSNLDRRAFIKDTATLGGGLILGQGISQEAQASHGLDLLASWDDPRRPEVPRRLTEVTRELARRALSGEYREQTKNAEFALKKESLAGLSRNMRYGKSAMLVAEKAPLRIIFGERIVGSATLLEAVKHSVPVLNISSTSHTTIGWHRVLKIGYRGLRQEIEDRLARRGLDESGIDLLNSMLLCLDAADVWHRRHMETLEDLAVEADGFQKERYLEVHRALARVPEHPPETFHEAVQSLWFMYAFHRLMGNWIGIGRIDEMLGPYLERDLAARRVTLDDARDILAHFWIKGAEWAGIHRGVGGDAQHYQNILLSGVDAQGRDVTNNVTYLVLDIVEELHISDFPIAVRLNSKSPRKLLHRIGAVQRHGGGIVAVYNEEVVIEGLVQFGYSLEEARTFANDGCWEVLIPGKTAFSYVPFDGLTLLHEVLELHKPENPAPDFSDFEELYQAYRRRLSKEISAHHKRSDRAWKNQRHPTPLVSLFVDSCIERGRSYSEGGACYNVMSPHIGGMANIANSLLVLKKLVYEEQYLTLPEMVRILRDDWRGNEHLRRLIQRRFEFYGNDNDAADDMLERVFNDYTDLVAQVRESHGVLRPAGISTFGREIAWGLVGRRYSCRKASPDGHRLGAVLATNFSPSPGTDKKGPTAAIKSYCKVDLTRTPGGATLELKIHPDCVQGPKGPETLAALMRSFVRLGGWFLHIDVVDSAMLIDAQRHPEKHPNLTVRLAGWSARFATLDKNWQDMVIQRTQQYL
jgi:pyruvate-formate lyase